MTITKKFKQIIYLFRQYFMRMLIPRALPGDKKRVLIVRLDGIGDFFVWLHCAATLLRFYRDAEVTLLANSLWADTAKSILKLDRVIPFSTVQFINDFSYRIKMLTDLRREGFDIVIQPRRSREFLVEDQITAWCGAPVSFALKSDRGSVNPRLMRWSDRWYSTLIVRPPEVVHESEVGELFVEKIVGAGFSSIFFLPEKLVELPPEWTAKPYYIVVPGAADPGRRLPPEKFAAALTGMMAFGQGIICGSEDEQPLAAALMKAAPQGNWLDLTGKTSLLQLVELIRGALLVLGNETGPIHIAARCGVPSVVILGGGHWGRFLPYPPAATLSQPHVIENRMPCYGCNWRCCHARKPDAPFPCIEKIEVSALTKALVGVMSHHVKTQRFSPFSNIFNMR